MKNFFNKNKSENNIVPLEKVYPLNSKEKWIKDKLKDFRKFLAVSTTGMALGLFGTLIIGTIIAQIALIPGLALLDNVATIVKGAMGAGIGLGVGISMKKKGIQLITSLACGAVGGLAFNYLDGSNQIKTISDPLSCYICVVLSLYLSGLILRKPTPIDILLIPLVGLFFATLYCFSIAILVNYITVGIGYVIKVSFDVVPILMCIIVSVLVGMTLTAPISSVAICITINIGAVPLAAGAAMIGCCTQMVGFAVQSAHDNKWGNVLAVGIGTSMLQFKNIIKKPIVWLPTIIASAILGPFAYVLNLTCTSTGAGMGTCGIVGILEGFYSSNYAWDKILWILLFCIVLPIILVYAIDTLFRKFNLIKKGDLVI